MSRMTPSEFPEPAGVVERTEEHTTLRLPDRIPGHKWAEFALLTILGAAIIVMTTAKAVRGGDVRPVTFMVLAIGAAMVGLSISGARSIRHGVRVVLSSQRLSLLRHWTQGGVRSTVVDRDRVRLSAASGGGIEVAYPGGASRIGTALDPGRRDATLAFLTATLAGRPPADLRRPAGPAATVAAREFPYRAGPAKPVVILVILLGLAGGFSVMAQTHQPLDFKGVHLGPARATPVYYGMAAFCLVVTPFVLRDPYRAWADPRRLVLHRDRLEVIDENTDTRRILPFAELTNLRIVVYKGIPMALLLDHPAGRLRINREFFEIPGAIEGIRDGIDRGLASGRTSATSEA